MQAQRQNGNLPAPRLTWGAAKLPAAIYSMPAAILFSSNSVQWRQCLLELLQLINAYIAPQCLLHGTQLVRLLRIEIVLISYMLIHNAEHVSQHLSLETNTNVTVILFLWRQHLIPLDTPPSWPSSYMCSQGELYHEYRVPFDVSANLSFPRIDIQKEFLPLSLNMK